MTSRRYVDAVGFWCVLGYTALAFLARQTGEPDLRAFFVLAAWTGLPVFGLFLHFRRAGEPFPVSRLLFWAIAFRLIGLVGGPFYEDDFYRYLWDGYRFATAGTPYGAAPEEFFVDPAVPALFQGVLDGVNYPELPTIYAPVTQVVFLVAYWIKPASIGVLQAILIAVDLAVVGLLLRLAPARNVLLYAWCPLVIKETAFTAHPDGVGVCLLLAAIVLARDRRWWFAAALLGLAVATKTFALVLAPLILVGARFRHWLIFAGTLAACYLPFVVAGGTDLVSLLTFARDWEYNSAVFGLLGAFVPPSGARLVVGLLFAAFWGWYCLRYVRGGERGIPRGDLLFGVLLLLSPVINPWYLLWLLPFAVLFPSFWAWTASAAILLSYVTGLNLPDFTLQPYAQPLWVRGLEFGLIGLALAVDLTARRRREMQEDMK
ncbi:MAG: glycosyltransferase 87 family protein [Acidobacteriota bacterium]|nr:glycosyltransferase 87 family protein [Acidobacteriota bacterium]MDE3266037.1 glycosyltransferase 87 family protein [Acidobacteriota bacterium]